MENQIENIELINNYLNKNLSGKDLVDFENRLKKDNEFRALYDEHVIILEGIKRQRIKTEIKLGKQRYLQTKWLRYLGFGSLIVVLIIVCLNLFKSEENDFKNKLNFESEFLQEIKVPIDSIIEVKGDKGTVLRFNPDDLETKSGKALSNDSLIIELIELTSKQDLLLANAQTVSKDKWLISGGAFKIDIKQGNSTLVLKERKTIDLIFPKSTNEGGMELFYGKRDVIGDMNWSKADLKIQENPFVILYEEGFVFNTTLTKKYGGVETFKSINVIDTLGFLSLEKLRDRFNKINFQNKNTDTIRLIKETVHIIDEEYDCEFKWLHKDRTFKVKILDSLYYKKEIVIDSVLIDLDVNIVSECRELIGEVTKQVKAVELKGEELISKADYIKFQEEYLNYRESIDTIQEIISTELYRSIRLSKLGWINIDKFTSDEVKVKVALHSNIDADYEQLYLVDQNNNTILNVYDNSIDLPVNRSFHLIGIAQKGKTIYGYKKEVRFDKNGSFQINYKKIEESQIKSLLIIDEIEVKENKIKPEKIITESLKGKKDITKKEVKSKSNIIVTIPKKAPETIRINTSKDTSIVFKEGTKLIIKANSFIDDVGTKIVGNVDIKVTEYYKLSDILLANLNTHCNDQLLETGGMLYIEAMQDDKKLQVANTKPIEISFADKKKNMQLFYGELENEIINWKPQQETEVVTEDIQVTPNENDVEVPFYEIEEPPIYPGCEGLSKNKAKKCFKDAVDKFIRKNFNTKIANDLRLKGLQRITGGFKINRDGDIVDIRARSKNPYLEIEAERVIGLLPKMTPGKQRGKVVSVGYTLPIRILVDGETIAGSSTNNSKQDTVTIPDYIKNTLKNRDTRNISVSEANNYVLSTSNLGWINCDRFVRVKDKIKYKLKINDADGEIKLSMIFKSWKSVLPSWRFGDEFDFKTVPNNEEVVIVAIKKLERKLYFDVLSTKTVENPDIEFSFKEMDIELLKQELRKLDIMF
ncbi:energy transducer TonB [Hyunsoonleella pacifica]|uniref:Uncharacterized protein n=1 Tax=Hyunsoonleella pacifica TaxID=1080224 RepID=A0A4Q9FPE3_9FLAO|nr:hypothetical protein [Hyunsoonleella pacifica]TBN16605.1 hypothetical protein EYD46_08195 [Hyunsoonleella pacifica]GGD18036.1 hypothetical protein GCM10011368_19930 [Hyunsoonleella pacifica]